MTNELKRLRDREYYYKHKEISDINHKIYYQNNKDKIKKYAKKYYNDNIKNNPDMKDIINARSRNAYRNNFKSKQKYQKQHWYNIKLRTMRTVGELHCVRCGFDDIRALHIDHIDSGGCKHRKEFSSNKTYMKYVEENPQYFQILCANCNFIKRYENNEFRKSKYDI